MHDPDPQDEPPPAAGQPGQNRGNSEKASGLADSTHSDTAASEIAGSPSSTTVDKRFVMRLRELELELQKTRNEAEAARLEARASELELRIQRLSHRGDHEEDTGSAAESAEVARINANTDQLRKQIDALRQNALEQGVDLSGAGPKSSTSQIRPDAKILRVDQEESAVANHDRSPPPATSMLNLASSAAFNDFQFDSWDEVRQTIHRVRGSRPSGNVSAKSNYSSSSPADSSPPSKSSNETQRARSWRTRYRQATSEDGEQFLRIDAAHPDPELAQAETEDENVSHDDFNIREDAEPSMVDPSELQLDEEISEAESTPRSRPAAWLISLIAHVLILVFLALFTLSNSKPGDQIAIAGSFEQADEVALESIEIETPEVEIAEETPTPSETPYEISEVGEMAATEIEIDAPRLPTQSMIDSIDSSSISSKSMMSLKSDSKATMKFCGLEGGGNHFVYLVDSSGSMGDAFQSARRELLQSIEALKSDQRFYVVFFDAEPNYMRLSSTDIDEPRSVYATRENKASLQRWATTIQMDRGRAPWDALRFAIDLRPDVIFLLSDGEFPESIENLLNEINRVDNLFGDDDPISIVHTIGYHSREGESRMRRIAKQHGGQYRHVPKP